MVRRIRLGCGGWGGKGYCASVIDFDSETFWQEAVGFREGSGEDVGEGSSDAGG